MSTLKSDINRYFLGLEGIKDYFEVRGHLGILNDFTDLKWSKMENNNVIVSNENGKMIIPYSETQFYVKARYTMIVNKEESYILDNLKKVDKFKLYLEDGK